MRFLVHWHYMCRNILKRSRFPFLAKTGFFYWALVATFLALFFVSYFDVVFDTISLRFWRVWESKMCPKIDFWRGFWDAFWAPSFQSVFFMHFYVVFNAQLRENSDFT